MCGVRYSWRVREKWGADAEREETERVGSEVYVLAFGGAWGM
jgi:hypothetical protein